MRLMTPPLAGCVASLEDDDDLEPFVLDPFEHLHQLDLEPEQLFLVAPVLDLLRAGRVGAAVSCGLPLPWRPRAPALPSRSSPSSTCPSSYRSSSPWPMSPSSSAQTRVVSTTAGTHGRSGAGVRSGLRRRPVPWEPAAWMSRSEQVPSPLRRTALAARFRCSLYAKFALEAASPPQRAAPAPRVRGCFDLTRRKVLAHRAYAARPVRPVRKALPRDVRARQADRRWMRRYFLRVSGARDGRRGGAKVSGWLWVTRRGASGPRPGAPCRRPGD